MCLLRLATLMMLATSVVHADVYNFPAKSVNIGSAYTEAFFAAHTLTSGGTGSISPAADAHAVHGVQLADGGFVLTGKAVESDGSSVHEAFAVKLDAAGSLVWGWKSGVSGQDAANAAAQLPNGEILIAGFRDVGGVLKRSITKLNQADGTEIWTATDFGDASASSNGALEMITVDDTLGVLAAGFHNKPDQTEMSFKSYGNVGSGEAVVMSMTIATLSSSTVPTSANVANTKTFTGYISAKTAHYVSATKVAVLLGAGDNAAKKASLAAYNPSDNVDIFLTDHSSTIGEGTDMQLVGTTHAVITGQGKPTGMTVGYSGKLTKLSLSDGSRLWTQEYSSCGSGTVSGAPSNGECSKGLIYNECWGVAVMADGGFTVSCGTGIEGCPNTMSGQMLSDCQAGLGDKRSGAYPRGASIWDSMTIKASSDGTLEWMRSDTYKAAAWPALPTAPSVPMYEGAAVIGSTAGEWPIKLANGGGVAIITDQMQGIGLLKLAPVPASDPKKILLVGDSWASYSGNSFTTFCSGAQQINKGVGGSTAVQWSTSASEDTTFSAALTAAGTMNGNDRIVLSVGGNDWIGINCQGKTLQTLQGEIQAAADALIAAVTATGCGSECPSIWMFGYAMVSSGSDGCANLGAAALQPLQVAINNVATATAAINYHDITNVCGGSATSLSPTNPCFGMGSGQDNIHMNRQGYCKTITLPAVQTALGCSSASYDCATVDKDLTRAARDAAMCTSYASCPATGISSPTPAATSTPTSAPTAPARKITQDVTVTSVTLEAYEGDLRRVYETAFAISVSLWDTANAQVKAGCSVSSTAVAASRRAGTKITFTAQANSANSDAAKASAEGNTASVFIANIATANTALSTSVTAPTSSQLTVTAASVAVSSGAASSEDSSSSVITVVVVIVVIVVAVALVAFWYCTKSPAANKMGESSASFGAPTSNTV